MLMAVKGGSKALNSIVFYIFNAVLGFPFHLQAVGKDNIGVHCPNVQMVNEGTLDSVWNLLQGGQLLLDFIAYLRKYKRSFMKLSRECRQMRG